MNEYLELIGYLASVVVAISLMMSSLVKLRIINLIGSLMFSFYGFAIGAVPVGVLNGFIAAINIYYILKMKPKKEFYKILHVRSDNYYLNEFLSFYNNDIKKFFPSFNDNKASTRFSFFILRNMAVAGIMMAHEKNKETLYISLDYVIPEYRDLKPGKFLYNYQTEMFKEKGYKKLLAKPESNTHEKYLTKMGFVKDISSNELYLNI